MTEPNGELWLWRHEGDGSEVGEAGMSVPHGELWLWRHGGEETDGEAVGQLVFFVGFDVGFLVGFLVGLFVGFFVGLLAVGHVGGGGGQLVSDFVIAFCCAMESSPRRLRALFSPLNAVTASAKGW